MTEHNEATVEAVAKAMYESGDALSERWQWSSIHGEDRAHWLNCARAALDAMGLPSRGQMFDMLKKARILAPECREGYGLGCADRLLALFENGAKP